MAETNCTKEGLKRPPFRLHKTVIIGDKHKNCGKPAKRGRYQWIKRTRPTAQEDVSSCPRGRVQLIKWTLRFAQEDTTPMTYRRVVNTVRLTMPPRKESMPVSPVTDPAASNCPARACRPVSTSTASV
jgi:hypothetical protein